MHYLSEDPWPILYILGGAAVVCLIALRITQQGKFLIWAGLALGLALAVFGIERLWVTENERIEAVVVELGRAVRAGDVEAALAQMAPEVSLEQGNQPLLGDRARGIVRLVAPSEGLRGALARGLIRGTLERTRFDFLTISAIHAEAGTRSGLGTAEFRVHASGSFEAGGISYNFATGASGSDWSLGFREVAPHTWQVTRITATRLPPGFQLPWAGGLR